MQSVEPAKRQHAPAFRRRLSVGAELVDGGVHFRVWAPQRKTVSVAIADTAVPLVSDGRGYFEGIARGAGDGTRYAFKLDDDPKLYPDPASRFQPEGPHELSQVVDPRRFPWSDAAWRGCRLLGQVLYEMHVGTFTRGGTFAAAADKLPLLLDVGVTCIELMPLAEFGGTYGWGYDGVNWFAPTRLYGQPDDFRRFVDYAHALGLAVILDVVYNHFGPDGNYLKAFGSDYFSTRHTTDWGEALNFDGPKCDAARTLVRDNVRHWIEEYHLDGLRIDATQDIHDDSSEHILRTIVDDARRAAGDKDIIIIGENEPQLSALVRDYGFDALWNDDFHHSAMVAATGKREAYYLDYVGGAQELLSAVKWGYLYQGQRYSWQKARRGAPALDLAPEAYVLFIQNHDQVANSATGDRLPALTSTGRYRALTALFLLSPGTPMLFQGQEFAASTPFLYFADHHGELGEAVTKGRAVFLTQFASIADVRLSDPTARTAFEASILDWRERESNAHVVALHRDLLQLRRTQPFAAQARRGIDGAVLAPECFVIRYFGIVDGVATPGAADDHLLLVNLGPDLRLSPSPEPLLGIARNKQWTVVWSSEDIRYGGRGTGPIDADEDGWRVPAHAAVVLNAKERVQ